MLLQLALVAIPARADGADERLLAGVNAYVRHVAFASEEPLVAHLTSERNINKTLLTNSNHKDKHRCPHSSIIKSGLFENKYLYQVQLTQMNVCGF